MNRTCKPNSFISNAVMNCKTQEDVMYFLESHIKDMESRVNKTFNPNKYASNAVMHFKTREDAMDFLEFLHDFGDFYRGNDFSIHENKELNNFLDSYLKA